MCSLVSEEETYEPHFDHLYPRVQPGETVDSRIVREHVPNTHSLSATLDNYQVLPGIRHVQMSHFPGAAAHHMFYSADDHQRVDHLSQQIHHSKEINPLIVVHDHEGPYVLEGGHRMASLHKLGAKSFPAMVSDRSGFYSSPGWAIVLQASVLVIVVEDQLTNDDRGSIIPGCKLSLNPTQ
jgi:hypothetical protein